MSSLIQVNHVNELEFSCGYQNPIMQSFYTVDSSESAKESQINEFDPQ